MIDQHNQNQSPKIKDEDSKSWQKLPYKIFHVSSEDEKYPAKELISHTPMSKGWQSVPFCNYPQEILLEFPKPVQMRRIQFLSHQYNIASRIEIYINKPGQDKFKKIGYFSLQSNENSDFQARELKTVHTNCQLTKVKFHLLQCHINQHNVYSQVGLIAINIYGEYPLVIRNDYDRKDVSIPDEENYDQATLKRLKDLCRAKDKAVELEDFDEAKKIKNAIDSLKSVSQSLVQLEEKKRLAIQNEDFDSAKVLKCEIDRLRNAVSGVKSEVNKQNEGHDPYKQLQEERKNMNISRPGTQQSNRLKLQDQYPSSNDDNHNFPGLGNEEPVMQNKAMNLYKQQKQIVDVDAQMVGAHEQDFNNLLDQKLKEQGGEGGLGGGNNNKANNNNNNNNQEEDEKIPVKFFQQSEPLIPVLSYPIVSQIFSKRWKSKEEALKSLIQEVQSYPNSSLLKKHPIDSIITSCLGACSVVLTIKVSQPIQEAMNLINLLFNKFQGTIIQGQCKPDFDKYSSECMKLLIEHLGDTQQKKRANDTILECASFSSIGTKVVSDQLISGAIKANIANSTKHLIGRINLVTQLVSKYGLNNNDITIVMAFAIKSYTSQFQDVRDAGLELIINIHQYVGNNIRNYFKDLRTAQINTLEKALRLDDEFEQNDEAELIQQQQQVKQPKKQSKQQQQQQKEHEQLDNDEMINESQMINMNQQSSNNLQQSSNYNNEESDDSEHTCRYCGLSDPNFTSDHIMIHQFKECPMLILCFKCNNIVEIPGLNFHFTNECSQKKAFKICQRCKESILIKDYDTHISSKICLPFKAPNIANRCPLCHYDITPSGKIGWEKHLLQDTCPNNPRSQYQ